MLPAARISRASAYSSVEKPLRMAQACAKTAETAKLRPSLLSGLEGEAPCSSFPGAQSTGCNPSGSGVSAACKGRGTGNPYTPRPELHVALIASVLFCAARGAVRAILHLFGLH
jgi:hypothetical protein